MGSYSSALIPDPEEFNSVVSLAEKLNEQVAHVADERLQSELQTLAAPPGLNSDRPPSRHPPNLEQLQTDLRDLRDQFELMKTQHNKEIKLLMNELDEEKRIRLTLQMEIQRMKKHMSK